VPPPLAFGTRTPILLAALVSAVFLAFLLSATGGHFVPPVTDLYVVCQYAKAIAEGHAFHYNPGEPASTGATSLLHTAILALAHGVGFRGEALVAFAVGLGIVLFVASVALATRLATRMAGPREGILAGCLVALGAPVAWGFLYGSDIALFLFLALWLFERLVATWEGTIGSAALAACLLALARPEGLPIALILALAWWRRGRGRLAWLRGSCAFAVGFGRSTGCTRRCCPRAGSRRRRSASICIAAWRRPSNNGNRLARRGDYRSGRISLCSAVARSLPGRQCAPA